MLNSPLSQEEHPQFSGHETFPMRYGWLKKAYDFVEKQSGHAQTGSVFNDPSAIAQLGVGKNMVSAIRHWALQCQIIQPTGKNTPSVTAEIGKKLLDDNGLDPYLENPSSLWLLHWLLATNSRLVTWFWVFNHYYSDHFDRETLTNSLVKLSEERGWPRASATTIKRDVECFVRTYATKTTIKKQAHEDTLESPLTELGLLKATGKKDGFRIVRGAKHTLGNGVFAFSVNQFWNTYTNANTLSLEALAHQPGSPGRVFQLGEDDLLDRLMNIEHTTNQNLHWSESAGLKQLIREKSYSDIESLHLLESDYL